MRALKVEELDVRRGGMDDADISHKRLVCLGVFHPAPQLRFLGLRGKPAAQDEPGQTQQNSLRFWRRTIVLNPHLNHLTLCLGFMR